MYDEINILLHKWLEGRLTHEEIDSSPSEFREMIKDLDVAVKRSTMLSVTPSKDKKQVWDVIEEQITSEKAEEIHAYNTDTTSKDESQKIRKWLEGTLTKEEILSSSEALQKLFRELEKPLSRIKSYQVPESKAKKEAWEKLSAKIQEIQGETDDSLIKWMEGKLLDEDKDSGSQEFRQIFDELDESVKRTSEFSLPKTKSKDEVWKNLMGKIHEEENDNTEKVEGEKPSVSQEVPQPKEVFFEVKKKSTTDTGQSNISSDTKEYSFFRKNVAYFSSAAAAVVLLGLGLVFFKDFNSEYYEAEYGQQLALVLPHKSEIHLNAGSSIEYNPKEWKKGSERNVTLDGEGYFKVTEGTPFNVLTGDDERITVLGTSFNIKDRHDVLRVDCIEGVVKVARDDGEYRIVEKGQSVRLNEDGTFSEIFNNDKQRVHAWQRGEFYFTNTPLGIVLGAIQRQYNVSIDLDDKTHYDRLYTGFFTNKNLREALETVATPMGLRYKVDKEDREVYLSHR